MPMCDRCAALEDEVQYLRIRLADRLNVDLIRVVHDAFGLAPAEAKMVAALYQALHRLERRGLIASEWGVSENNRRAKYYHLTAPGRAQLRSEVSEIRRYVAALFKVLEPAG